MRPLGGLAFSFLWSPPSYTCPTSLWSFECKAAPCWAHSTPGNRKDLRGTPKFCREFSLWETGKRTGDEVFMGAATPCSLTVTGRSHCPIGPQFDHLFNGL